MEPSFLALAVADMDRGPIYTDRILTLPDAEQYTVHFYNHHFPVVVTSQESAVRRWMTDFSIPHDPYPRAPTRSIPAAFSFLWIDNHLLMNQEIHRPATIQLCVNDHCLVFQIGRAGHKIMPSSISELLQRRRFIFHAWSNDHRRLQQHYGVRVANPRWLPQPENIHNRRLLIEHVVLKRLRRRASFPEDVFLSRWDDPELSIEQVQYAALEVCLARLIGIMRSL